MDDGALSKHAVVRGNFVGAVLEDVTLPIPQQYCGTHKGHGPVLLYQIGEHDTRILIDIKNPLPADLRVSIRAPTHACAFVAKSLTELCPCIESHSH